MKRQTQRYLVLTLLTLLSGYLYIITPPPSSPTLLQQAPKIDAQYEEREGLTYLNHLRTHAGLVPLKENPSLKQSAKNHANYLIVNQKIGHHEEHNRSGYTGEYGSERSIHAGYQSALIIENVSSNNLDHKTSIDGLMSAIYHRFGFLDFHINEIGIGVLQDQQNRFRSAFVYDMGNQELNQLCAQNMPPSSSQHTVHEVCANPQQQLSKKAFFHAIYSNHTQNAPMVVYPYPNQTNIPPAFYEELPDPLPEHSVSGFPISISFDESRFKKVELLSFQLFDEHHHAITDVLEYNQTNDPNQRLKKFEFALFPLQRLAWASQYHVEVTYRADGTLGKKVWSFQTQKFDIPLHTITPTSHPITMVKGESMIFYFPPFSPKDTLQSLRYPSNFDIHFIDKNTIKLKVQERRTPHVTLKIGAHRLKLNITES